VKTSVPNLGHSRAKKPIWRLGGSSCPKLRTLEKGLLGMDSHYPRPLGHRIPPRKLTSSDFVIGSIVSKLRKVW
jgi:hypothetical protein